MRPHTKVKIVEVDHKCFGRIGTTKSPVYAPVRDEVPYIPVVTRDSQGRRCTSYHLEHNLQQL